MTTTLVQAADEEVPDRRHVLHALDSSGDTRLIWDPENAAEVAAAKNLFTELKKKGFVAYKVNRKGDKTSEVIRDFDPEAEKMIMAPALRGG